MASCVLVTAIIAFMAGCASAIFLMLVIGIRKGDRTKRPPGAGKALMDTFTRTLLGTGTWPRSPTVRGDREEN